MALRHAETVLIIVGRVRRLVGKTLSLVRNALRWIKRVRQLTLGLAGRVLRLIGTALIPVGIDVSLDVSNRRQNARALSLVGRD